MGGMVLETNMNEIVAQIEAQNRLEKSEVSTALHFTLGGSPGLGQQEEWVPVLVCISVEP